MKLRIFCIIHAIVSICVGVCLYLLFGNNIILYQFLNIKQGFFSSADFIGKDIICYYLPDTLWSYGFCAALCALYVPKNKGIWICVLSSITFGTVWEIAQLFNQVPGTFDYFDFAAYVLGALIFCLLFIKKRGKEK